MLAGESQDHTHAALEQAEQQQRAADREQDRAGVVDPVTGLRSTFSWKRRVSTQAAASPSGMFTKKIQRQDRKSENTPPRAGPTTDAIPHTLAM